MKKENTSLEGLQDYTAYLQKEIISEKDIERRAYLMARMIITQEKIIQKIKKQNEK